VSIEATTLRVRVADGDLRERTEAARRHWLATVGASFGLSRLLVLLAALPALLQHTPGAGPWPILPRSSALSAVLSRWDGAWYVLVAQRGYPGRSLLDRHLSDVAFHPGYPLLVRGLSAVTHLSLPTAAVVVSTVFGFLATALVFVLADRWRGRETANRAAFLFALFPGSFVLSMAYAEGLMLAATAAALLLVMQRRWLWAGLAAAVATAARPNALPIVLTLACIAVYEIVRRREWRALVAPLLGSAGIGSYYLYLWIHSGQFTAWLRSERVMWHDHPTITGLASLLAHAFTHLPSLRPGGFNGVLVVAGTLAVGAGLWFLWRSGLPRTMQVYGTFALVMPLTSAAVGPRPRMLLAAFPLALVGAERLSARGYRRAVVASAVGLVVLTVLTTTTLTATP
jgi:hypothetical protein